MLDASPRSALRPPSPFNAEAVKRNGYFDQGLVVVSIHDHRLSWDQREMLKQIAEKIFGKRS